MHLDPQSLLTDVWIVLVIVWLVASLGAKPSRRVQSVASRLITSSFIICGVLLLFSTKPRMGPLSWRFVPESDEVAWTGFALTLAGIALSIWVRVILGGNWSGRVTIKTGSSAHPAWSLRRGPASHLFRFSPRDYSTPPLWPAKSAAWWDEFGAEYVNYMRRVKALVPFVV